MKIRFCVVLLIGNLWPVLSLNIVMFDVPSFSKHGDSVELSCIYDLKKDKLYSVKYYKNDVEFYRYVPKDWPPGQFLPINGIRVDMQKSGKNQVYLRSVDLNSAGKYRCEVSAEAPSFNTAEAEKEMKVYVLPHEGPKITGLAPKYKVGDIITANCSSSKSKPASRLKWFVNKKEIPADWAVDHSTTLHSDGLESSSSSLQFTLNANHFSGSKGQAFLRIKCLSTLAKMHTLSSEVLVFRAAQHTHEQQRPKSVNEESNEILPSGADLNWQASSASSSATTHTAALWRLNGQRQSQLIKLLHLNGKFSFNLILLLLIVWKNINLAFNC